MQSHDGEWKIAPAELAALFHLTGRPRGPLDVLPPIGDTDASSAARQARSSLDPDQGRLLDECLGVLGDPGRVVRVHYSLADTRVSRSVLASSSALPGVWVTVSGTTDPVNLSTRSEPELRHLIGDVLAAGGTLRPTRLGCDFSTGAAVTLLAILDQARRSWLVSMLRHLEPVGLFSQADVTARLAAAGEQDFRWVLPLTDKLLPIPTADLAVTRDPRPALLELIEVGLIEPVDPAATVFDLTEAGRLLAEGNRQAASRLVLAQTYFTPDRQIAHDVMVLIRTPFELVLTLMSGAEASLATLLPGDLDSLLSRVFAPLLPAGTDTDEATVEDVLERTAVHVPLPDGPPVASATPGLRVITGPAAGQWHPLQPGATLGRRADNPIPIPDSGISRCHARFHPSPGGGWQIEDLGSANGTLLNGQRITTPTRLTEGDRITVSETTLTFHAGLPGGAQ